MPRLKPLSIALLTLLALCSTGCFTGHAVDQALDCRHGIGPAHEPTLLAHGPAEALGHAAEVATIPAAVALDGLILTCILVPPAADLTVALIELVSLADPNYQAPFGGY